LLHGTKLEVLAEHQTSDIIGIELDVQMDINFIVRAVRLH